MTWVSVDLCLVPIGVGVSLSPFIAACQRQIAKSGLKSQLGPNGTAIEGPWEEVMACVHACHQDVHRMGAPRIYTTLKINTRTDRNQSFEDKVNAVERCLNP
ncbi:MTH1187 family thiamine-binding protein [Synechococcus sp. CC9616]|uniref:MTH1187 family thiamine-binding protein n=1 Tax=Synechococcus sp. CC9616 TaxID=110663 RepID=UPI0004ACD00A|nr:MTH1187 family thiamine-binding protein [Synechococcus sp. CC9616]